MGNNMSLVVAVGVPLLGGIGIGAAIGGESRGPWYKNLKKPSWNPPGWVFGPVWTVLYAAMGYASHRVWQAGGGSLPLTLYAVQLALNFVWSPLFFKAKNLKAASIDITALLGVLGATVYEFGKVDTAAAQLMLPYLGWVSFATALTYNIWLNNDEAGQRTKQATRQAAAGAESAARQAGEAVAGAASEATAKAANVFLAQGGEKQGDEVPPEAAAATAARTSATGGDAGAGTATAGIGEGADKKEL